LARLGDESDPVVEISVGNLAPPHSENENIIKFYALDGLSYIQGRPEIVDTLLKMAQYDENVGVRKGAIYALSAIGNSAATNFLEYQSQHGNKSAKIGLELFGKADFHTINLIDLFGLR
jgi:HEAT repeat protein